MIAVRTGFEWLLWALRLRNVKPFNTLLKGIMEATKAAKFAGSVRDEAEHALRLEREKAAIKAQGEKK